MKIFALRMFTPPQTFVYTPQFQIPRNNPDRQPDDKGHANVVALVGDNLRRDKMSFKGCTNSSEERGNKGEGDDCKRTVAMRDCGTYILKTRRRCWLEESSVKVAAL